MHSFLLWHHLSCSFLFLRVLIMRYLLHQSQFKELHARQTYLYDIFHLYFVPTKSEGNFIVLVPLGRNYSNILFITGHTNFVWEYMLSHIHQLPSLVSWYKRMRGERQPCGFCAGSRARIRLHQLSIDFSR